MYFVFNELHAKLSSPIFLDKYRKLKYIYCDLQYMTLGEKLRYLRLVEGNLRGLGRDMTQQEVVRAITRGLEQKISRSYLSQLENGWRPHLTNKTRLLLAKVFTVHPGYLGDDALGFPTGLP